MSKPDKPGELRDVTVSTISLVSKAANGEKFKIFKSAEDEAPESVERNERGLFHILKRFFTSDNTENNEQPTPEIKEAESELEKSGRKISGSRLSKLKSIRAMLQEVLNDIDDKEETSQEAEELTKEEILKAVDEAIKPVSERIEKINIDEAINKALAPVIERIEKIENARGVSNRVPEEGNIEKSDSDFWG